MANDIRVCRTSAATHRHTCVLHGDDPTSVCSGSLRRGGKCSHRASGPQIPGMMPTCKMHRDQLKMSGWCQAPLTCGFECGHIYEWKPHGFPLCPAHREYQTACYFLKIPTELRFRIYRYLLPDGPIPARHGIWRTFRSGGDGVHLEILRVNHQIHDEAVDLLYGATVFTIELSDNCLSMCNSAKLHNEYPVLGVGRHALQDYQMQLMLLEQQNKKRLLMARQEQNAMNGNPNPVITGSHMHSAHAIKPLDLVWHPPLSKRYFDMIHCFVVEIVFPVAGASNQGMMTNSSSSNTADAAQKYLERRLYDLSDYLHRIVERLRQIQTPIAQMKVMIKFGNTYNYREDVFSATKMLLQPFQRLRNANSIEVASITTKDLQGNETELLASNLNSDRSFAEDMKCWSSTMSGSQPSVKYQQVFDAYWQLEKFISDVKGHCHYQDPAFNKFSDLLYGARVAREADDLESFRVIWNQVVDIWMDHLNSQENFQSNVAGSIDSIYDLVGGRSSGGPGNSNGS